MFKISCRKALQGIFQLSQRAFERLDREVMTYDKKTQLEVAKLMYPRYLDVLQFSSAFAAEHGFAAS